MKYKELPDGWITPLYKNFKMICCDCGLVHDADFRIRKGKIEFRVRRNNHATANTRRSRPLYRCKKCKVKCFYAPGIGEYCPKCGHDYNLEEICPKKESKS